MTASFDLPPRPPYGAEQASHFVQTNGIWQHIFEYGDSTAAVDVVLIPGLTVPAGAWDFVARALPDSMRAFVVDVRGRGLSDHPPSGYTLPDYAADLAGVLDRLRLREPILVGHSLGARIAAAFDVAAPGLAAGLVLVDPPLSGPGRAPYPNPLDMYEAFLDAAHAPEPSLAEYRKLEPHLASDDAVRERIRWLRSCDAHAVAETYQMFHEEDFHDLYLRVTAPALLVRGADSDVVTDEHARELSVLRPDIPIVAVADATHLVPQSNLDGFIDAVQQFTSMTVSSAAGAAE